MTNSSKLTLLLVCLLFCLWKYYVYFFCNTSVLVIEKKNMNMKRCTTYCQHYIDPVFCMCFLETQHSREKRNAEAGEVNRHDFGDEQTYHYAHQMQLFGEVNHIMHYLSVAILAVFVIEVSDLCCNWWARRDWVKIKCAAALFWVQVINFVYWGKILTVITFKVLLPELGGFFIARDYAVIWVGLY